MFLWGKSIRFISILNDGLTVACIDIFFCRGERCDYLFSRWNWAKVLQVVIMLCRPAVRPELSPRLVFCVRSFSCSYLKLNTQHLCAYFAYHGCQIGGWFAAEKDLRIKLAISRLLFSPVSGHQWDKEWFGATWLAQHGRAILFL